MPDEHAIPAGAEGSLDQLFAPLEASHPGESAFRLLVDGTEAFVTRVESARKAARSVDVQTYIWHDDLTGRYLAAVLLEAADRGAHVRLLVDDMDARGKNAGLAALAAHPNIEVRVFNPFASRSGSLSMVSEGARNFSRINRRMHNKTWIADNRIAMVGGRNLGDEYFGASDEVNFVDLDFAMIGPVVRDISASFDKYWNSPSAYPMEAMDAAAVDAESLAKLRERLNADTAKALESKYAKGLRDDVAVKRLFAGDSPMQWSGNYHFVSDDPLKISMEKKDLQRAAVGATLASAIKESRTTLHIISPYFVPGEKGSAGLIAAAHAGSSVSILTNSLAANDVAAVHGGYSRFRKSLLEGGVQLWELKPLPGSSADTSVFGSQGASLHTKALSVDDRTLFVGSYNLDPRSTWLNCEQGVLVDSPVLAAQFRTIFESQTQGERAWHVTLEKGDLSWTDGNEVFDSDPKASFSRRFQAWFARVFHIDAQL